MCDNSGFQLPQKSVWEKAPWMFPCDIVSYLYPLSGHSLFGCGPGIGRKISSLVHCISYVRSGWIVEEFSLPSIFPYYHVISWELPSLWSILLDNADMSLGFVGGSNHMSANTFNQWLWLLEASLILMFYLFAQVFNQNYFIHSVKLLVKCNVA